MKKNIPIQAILKISGFIYSILTFYFIIYKLLLVDYYKVPFDSDYGLLMVFLTWPIYLIFSVPYLLIVKKELLEKKSARFSSFFMLSPTPLGFLILLIVSFTGRKIFEPIYQWKTSEIAKGVSIVPERIENQGYIFDTRCECNRLNIRGEFKITNKVNFPITLYIDPDFGNDAKPYFKQGACQIESNSLYLYPLKTGVETKNFNCFFNEPVNQKLKNITEVKYTFLIEEKDNSGVRSERSFSSLDFADRINFQ